ncbi:MAG: hypothetical protein V3T40_05125 [Nitrososphaerales archaeon]
MNDIYYPVYRFNKVAAEDAAAQTSILPSEQRVSISVSVNFMIDLGSC